VQLHASEPRQFQALLGREIERWTTAARKAGVKPE
jgi:hypothetical protein